LIRIAELYKTKNHCETLLLQWFFVYFSSHPRDPFEGGAMIVLRVHNSMHYTLCSMLFALALASALALA